jgi:lipopolysaccharide transport system permease protein
VTTTGVDAFDPGGSRALYRRRGLARAAWDELLEAGRFRPLVWLLVSAALRTERVGSVFGYLWWLLEPLILMGVYVTFMDVILRVGGENFGFFVFISVVVWKYFAAGVRNAIVTTASKDRQMRQVRFPKSVLPLAAILAETVRFAFGLIVVITVGLFFGIIPDLTLVFLLPIVAIQFVLTLGVSLGLSALNVLFRDVQHVTVYAFQAWFFLSPGLYLLSTVPDNWRPIYDLNPFSTILPAYHEVLLNNNVPNLISLVYVGIGSLGVLIAGYLCFVRLAPSFAKVS